MKKLFSGILLTLLLTSMLTLALNIQLVRADPAEIVIDTEVGESRFTTYPARQSPYYWVHVHDHDTFRTGAYGSNFWYTLCGADRTGQPLYNGTWQASLPSSGAYEIFVWIPNPDPFTFEWREYRPTQSAIYQIYSKNGMDVRTVNQSLRKGNWYSIGTYEFDTTASVTLNDRTGEPYLTTMLAFDAIKFVARTGSKIFLDPSNFTFDTSTATVETLFNVTVRVNNVTNIKTWQAVIGFNDGIIKAVRSYEPTWDPKYVFYGRSTLFVGGAGAAGAGAALFPAPTPNGGFTGNGLLCIITFKILQLPGEFGVFTSALNFTSPLDTFYIRANESSKTSFDAYVSGRYQISWKWPPLPHFALDPKPLQPWPLSFGSWSNVIGQRFNVTAYIANLDSAWGATAASFGLQYNTTLINVTAWTIDPLWGTSSVTYIPGDPVTYDELDVSVGLPTGTPGGAKVDIITVEFEILFQDTVPPRPEGYYDETPIQFVNTFLECHVAEIPTTSPANGDVKIFCESAEWSFAVITDLHIGFGFPDYGSEGYDDTLSGPFQDYYLTERLSHVVESINTDPKVRFVVVLGDISDSAERSEFLKAREILNHLTVPYIPLIGNHDVWPCTEACSQVNPLISCLDRIPWSEYDPDVRTRDQTSPFATGDYYFTDVFWGNGNEWNIEKLEALFGTSWRGPAQSCRQFTSFHELRETGSWQILQNYNFTYKGIRFIALDCNERETPGGKSGARLYVETLEWLKANLEQAQALGQPTIILSHHPTIYCEIKLPTLGVQCFSREDFLRIRDTIETSKASLLVSFGGHSHTNFVAEKNYEHYFLQPNEPIVRNGVEIWDGSSLASAWNGLGSSVVITEAVCTESIKWAKGLAEIFPSDASQFPLRTDEGYNIRTVTVFKNDVAYGMLTKITESNLPPTSYFICDGQNPTTFKAIPYDPDPPWEDATWAYTYSWSFVKGTCDLQGGRQARHKYASAGDYEVTLTVTDETKAFSSSTRWITVPNPRPWWQVWGESPIDLVVTDPEGFTVTKDSREIAGMSYKELDVNGDGHLDDVVEVWELKWGDYRIMVIPKADASLTDTYTLKVSAQDEIIVLAENVSVHDIPMHPYIVRSTETGIIAERPPAPGDVNADGRVDMQDISLLADAFLTEPGHPLWKANCDINNDNSVDMADISIAMDHFMQT